MNCILWMEWFKCFRELRPAFSRERTFLWAIVAISGLTIRNDLRGISSIVGVISFTPACYHSLCLVFQSSAVNIEHLEALWLKLCRKLFSQVSIGGMKVFIGDGIKIPKEGKKMPAVKSIRQDSANNSKSEFIMGHSYQCIAMLVKAGAFSVCWRPANTA